jgi:UDP-N-acetyl-2-amino-2-deoxyglucuronate dehydrogenase
MIDKKIKFALVGCGRISYKHTDAIKNHLNHIAELVAVCDLKPDRAKQVGEENGVPFYSNYDDMLNKHDDVDVVSILTESGYHSVHAIDIVKKFKKNIVIEKPMALKLSSADSIIRICDEYGVKLFVVKQNRYNLPVVKLHEAIEQKRFGRIVMGTVRVRWCRTQEYYDQDAWRGTWALDGGVFSNQASHHIDLLEWMLGDPISVFAKSRTALVDIETEDTGVAVIQFNSGAIGIVEATTATRPDNLEGSLSILGERGSVEIGGFAVNKMKTWNFIDGKDEDDEIEKKYAEMPPNVYGFGHIKYLENVCNNLLYDTRALVDGLEGRKSLELINAIYESIETGKEVFLRFQPSKCRLGETNDLDGTI